MGILSGLGWSSLWSVFGILSLITMIWVAGPTLSIADYKPLAPIWVRVLLSVLICLIFLAVYLYKWYQTKKLNQHVIEEIKASELGSDNKTGSIGNSALQEQFLNIETVLQRHNDQQSKNLFQKLFADKNEYIYQKPWFLMVGASGVGKTTAILNSGLTFPVGTTDNVSKLIGTRDCDWFLTDEALLLDTAGRFVEQNDDINNSEDWNELLGLLKRCRTKQPINGLVLMVSTDDILSKDEGRVQQQLQQIRLRLQELQASFKTTYPLYIMVNKIDLISGFNQYFNYLTEEERKKVFGVDLDPLTPTSAEKINRITSEIDQISERIQKNLFTSVAYNNQQNDPSDLAIGFASEFSNFSQSLKLYLKRLLNLSRYDSDLNLAGVYFTSAVQQENESIKSTDALNYDLQEKYSGNGHATLVPKAKAYFVNQIFQTLLLNTANLAGMDNAWLKKRRKIYWICVAVTALVLLIFLFLLIRAYSHNHHYLDAVSTQLNKVESDAKNVDATNVSDLLNFTQKVYLLPTYNINKEYLDDSFIKNLGLSQFKDVEKAAMSKHQSLIDENLIPVISTEIDEQLKRSIDSKDYNRIYRNLKTYLMLYQPNHYSNDYINQWIVTDLMKYNANGDDVNHQSIQALKNVLSSKRIIAKNNYDPLLVSQARELLLHQDIANLIYADLVHYVRSLDLRSMPVVSFVSMGGSSTNTLFRRVSNKTLNEPISVLYTKYGYKNLFMPYVGERLNKFYKEEKWVLGDGVLVQSEDQVLADIYQLYAIQYTEAWKNYLKDIRMLQPQNLQQAIAMSKQLSEKNSSLAGIIKGISDNTNLMTPTVLNAETEQSQQKNQDKALEIGKNPVLDESKVQGYLQIIASNFSQFQSLTQTGSESGAQLDEIIKSINDLYVYLVALQLSMQSDDQLMPDTTPLVNYKAQVNRLPEPFRPMLDQFVTQVTLSSQQYKDAQTLGVAKQQDQMVQSNCRNLTSNKYPFVAKSTQDISLQELGSLFGKEGIYLKTLGANVAVSQNQNTPFILLLENNQIKRKANYLDAEKINMQYFAGRNTPHIDFVMRVIAMDKSIDNLNISYGGKKIQYYHGPQQNVMLSWPAQDNQIILEATSANEKPETLEVKGEWAIFRLIDQANKAILTNDGKGILATFNLDGKKVYIEFRAVSGNNPFNLTLFREFKC
ncbi:type VI secretion system membrane subunit TssM [Acinetobacter populi]|uniref:Type VI secretion protein IcmF n=1 Tax=Acinetobacter populi TaxID=1582270 RepID=A0A1Z9Z1C4_9GAMM|nr:type VI secretion system membrane subunit TssM [Acinetobacter populi]OUY08260.1 type VI secretion protein IcmF [Acinetobacter populi]